MTSEHTTLILKVAMAKERLCRPCLRRGSDSGAWIGYPGNGFGHKPLTLNQVFSNFN